MDWIPPTASTVLNPKMPCPICGAIVPNRHPVGKPFKCERCGASLQLSRRRSSVEGWIDLAIALIGAWMLGNRGWLLVGATVGLYIALLFLSVPISEKVWPSRLEPYDGGRVI